MSTWGLRPAPAEELRGDERDNSISLARVQRTRIELHRLRTDHEAWISRQREKPEAERYKTQLEAIDRLIDRSADRLRTELKSLDLSVSQAAIYEACRTFDLRILWLRRVWQFFREKLDQRDTDLGDVLRAADEIVWSCYQQVFERARQIAPELKAGASPLPFIESRYSPSTFPADLVPSGLQSEIDRPFLRENLNRLPVPVVRLQPSCVTGPWWLVYAAHEVGHNVHYDLLEGKALVDAYQELVERTVRDAKGNEADASRWGGWSREIFADVFSVLMMGPWAVWAMVELELQGDEGMVARREQYPSAVVRLELLAATADAVGLDGRSALRGLRPREVAARSVGATRDLEFVDAVVAASLGVLPGTSVKLARLCNFRLSDFQSTENREWGRVEALRATLVTGGMPVLEPALESPRLAASGSLAAWSSLMGAADEHRRSSLAEQSLRLIKDSGPPGTRASGAQLDATAAAVDVASALLAAGRDDLEP
jgi:hypothetical protein